MPTVDKTWTFTSDAEGFVDVGDSAITFAKDAGDPSVHFTGASTGTQERARSATGVTWEDLGVPAGANVVQVQLLSWSSRKWAVAAGETPTVTFRMVDSAGTNICASGDLVSVILGTGQDSNWVGQTAGYLRSVNSGKRASNTEVRLEIELDVTLASTGWDIGIDTIALRITYTTTPFTDLKIAGSLTQSTDPTRPDWTNLAGALQADADMASISINSQFGDNLQYTQFTWGISGVIDSIVGAEIELEGYSGAAGSTLSVNLTKNGTIGAGNPQLYEEPAGITVLGGPTDTWGTTISASDIAASTFGFIIGPYNLGASDTIQVEYAYMRLYYTLAVSDAAEKMHFITSGRRW